MRLPRHRRRSPAPPSPGGAGGPAPATTPISRPTLARAAVLGGAVFAGAVIAGAATPDTEATDTEPIDTEPRHRNNQDGGNCHRADHRLVNLQVIRDGGHQCGACGTVLGRTAPHPGARPSTTAAHHDSPVKDPSSGARAPGSSPTRAGARLVAALARPARMASPGDRRRGSVAALAVAAAGLVLLSGGVTLVVFGHPTTPTVAAQGILPAVQGTPERGLDGPAAPSRAAAVTAPVAPPTHLSIPAVDVNTDLINLATQDDGTLEVPKNFALAGWWDQGAAPGDVGPAVIVGHIDSYRGPAVFYRLRQLTPGALVTVGRSDGSTALFAVDALREFSKEAFPTNLVYGATDAPTLRLITCGGSFDDKARSYLDNIVVFAHEIPLPAPTAPNPPTRSGTPGPLGPGSTAPSSSSRGPRASVQAAAAGQDGRSPLGAAGPGTVQ